MNYKIIFGTSLPAFALPVLAFAHESSVAHVEDGAHALGADALLKALSPEWWGLLVVSIILMIGLSLLVRKYLNVEIPNSSPVKPESTSAQ